MIFGLARFSAAEDWPGWRGPRGDGSSLEQSVPDSWDGTTGKNILWKQPLQGSGHGSPIVFGKRLFVLTCVEESQERNLLCLDIDSGQTIWKRTVFKAPLEIKHKLNSFASSTPATDGQIVYVSFLEIDGSRVPARNVGNERDMTPGKILVAAYSLEGKEVWRSNPGVFASAHGFCSNPVLHENKLIINGDHDGASYLVALDCNNGKVLWKVPRLHQTRSYATPIIRTIGKSEQLVLPGSKAVTSFDPSDGSTIWSVDGPTEQFVASPVFNGKHFFVTAGFPTHHVIAIRPEGRDNVTDTHVSWHQTAVRNYVPSPLLVGDFLIVADDRGTANCFDVDTGERHWNVRLGRKFSASPFQAKGLGYFLAEDGTTHVVKGGKQFTQVKKNPLGERAYASPAVSQGRIFIRGEQSMFAIGHKSKTID